MKTLILNGSPRKNGETAMLINTLKSRLSGEIFQIDCYTDGISPCTDCRLCRKKPVCSINDKMQEVYDYLKDCDNVVIASPIFFEELSGRLLDVASRFQVYASALIFRHEKPELSHKKGAVILTAGGSGGMTRAYYTACRLLENVGVREPVFCVCSTHTDSLPANDDKAALSDIISLAKELNAKSV